MRLNRVGVGRNFFGVLDWGLGRIDVYQEGIIACVALHVCSDLSAGFPAFRG